MDSFVFQYHVGELHKLIEKTGAVLEGNCVYYHQTLQKAEELLNKQKNLFEVGKRIQHQMIEIGFNAGHSALLFLMAAPPNTTFHFFDIGTHPYVIPCFEYLQRNFPDKQMYLHIGDSRKTLAQWINQHPNERYDVVHVDGGHDFSCVKNDTEAAVHLCKKGGVIIMDDVQDPTIHGFTESIVSQGLGKPVEFELPTTLYLHRLLYRL